MASEKETFEALRYHITMGKYGEKQYRNALGQLHREDGPAVERSSGTKEWWLNGQRHRINGPAIEWANGGETWFLNDLVYDKADYLKACKALHPQHDY